LSEISKVYTQYQESLRTSQTEYETRLTEYADAISKSYDTYLKDFVLDFSRQFSDQVFRLNMKSIAEVFFQTSDIPFVAIDGSCHKLAGTNFISFYGGAYGSKGSVSISGTEGRIIYQRWELNKDVSMVAFVPIPPDVSVAAVSEDEIATDSPPVLSDSEIGEISSLHTKVMQLAEVYLAYSLASASVEPPRLLMLDNSIGGILANTSFSPRASRLRFADFDGERISVADMQICLAHPFNQMLSVPSAKNFQPHFRIIAESTWADSNAVYASKSSLPGHSFSAGARFLCDPDPDHQSRVGAGQFEESTGLFTFHENPRAAWRKGVRVFELVCERLFREKRADGLTYKVAGSSQRQYMTPRDIQFLTGVGLRALIEICWAKRILLIGVVKDSSSRFFYRNFLSSVLVSRGLPPARHLQVPLTDRSIIELLPSVDTKLNSPWGTVEFDSCFMTLHPELPQGKTDWIVKGYEHEHLGETTRPERIFLRTIFQFLLTKDRNIASHALFIDRLAYPGFDDEDSQDLALNTPYFGEVKALFYDKSSPSRLQRLSAYLLTVLVRNHYPEALGYPDPLHQADWGAKSMRKRIVALLDSSEWAFRARPLSKTLRQIRDSLGR
jgi:hypothetical protein